MIEFRPRQLLGGSALRLSRSLLRLLGLLGRRIISCSGCCLGGRRGCSGRSRDPHGLRELGQLLLHLIHPLGWRFLFGFPAAARGGRLLDLGQRLLELLSHLLDHLGHLLSLLAQLLAQLLDHLGDVFQAHHGRRARGLLFGLLGSLLSSLSRLILGLLLGGGLGQHLLKSGLGLGSGNKGNLFEVVDRGIHFGEEDWIHGGLD